MPVETIRADGSTAAQDATMHHPTEPFTARRETAEVTVTRGQKTFVLALLVAIATLTAIFTLETLVALIGGITFVYLLFLVLKFAMVSRSVSHSRAFQFTSEEVEGLQDEDCPFGVVLLPAYKEAAVMAQLTNAVMSLDYPKDRMLVLLIVRSDDLETLEAIDALHLPPCFEVVKLFQQFPETKPKALNVGLFYALNRLDEMGRVTVDPETQELRMLPEDWLVIYDSEDQPEPDQAKKAVLAFQQVDETVAAVQARASCYNQDAGLVARLFGAEYDVYYNFVIPALADMGLVVPLSGNSVFFRIQVLLEVSGWDPYNVAEDADIAVDIFGLGYRTAFVESVTWEEAPTGVLQWVRQRSRWKKGFMQSWLRHNRRPFELLRQMGLVKWLSFQLLIGGTPFVLLINPMLWALTVTYFVTKSPFIESLHPPLVFYVGLINMVFGNFALVYISMLATIKEKNYQSTVWMFFNVPYWLMMSWAAWMAFYELASGRAQRWHKTTHVGEVSHHWDQNADRTPFEVTSGPYRNVEEDDYEEVPAYSRASGD